MSQAPFPMGCLLLAALFLFTVTETAAQTYSGQATAVRSTITTPLQPVVTTAVADTGSLPDAGGLITLSSAGVTIPNAATVGSSNVSTQGSGLGSQSTASVNNVNIGVLGISITADVVSSSTNCSCPLSTCTGSFAITNLRIDGVSVVVTGDVNQTVPLPGGVGNLVINERIVSPRSITVNAVHVFVTAANLTTTDVIVASARSGINCQIFPTTNYFSGRGTDVRLTQTDTLLGTSVTTLIGDTGPLPTSGGVINVTTAGAGLSPLLSTGVVTAGSSGGVPGGNIFTTQSEATVNNLGINALGAVTINANVLDSDTQCTCTNGVGGCTGTSVITGLAVTALGLPFPVTITGQSNQTVTLPAGLGSLVINERIGDPSGNPADLTVNALRVNLNVAGLAATTIVVSSAHSDVVCALPPLASNATLSGRAIDHRGYGVGRVRVSVTDGDGLDLTALTNQFGYYSLEDLPVGRTYFVTPTHKQYSFDTRIVDLTGDLAGFDFVALHQSPKN